MRQKKIIREFDSTIPVDTRLRDIAILHNSIGQNIRELTLLYKTYKNEIN